MSRSLRSLPHLARLPRRRRAAAASLVAVSLTALGLSLPLGAVAAPDPLAASGSVLEPLADAAADHGRTLGFALAPDRLTETGYRSIADREFSLVVAENAMKWDATERVQGQFSFTGADQVAAYAGANNMDLYGHTLVWHSQLPSWVSALGTPAALRSAMTSHITAVAGHLRGKVTAWDVVNEAFEDDGSRRQSVFQTRLGDGYIEEAFRTARAADPGAQLCINDYSTDAVNAKSTAIYQLVKDFTARGVPIDCVGFQAHLIVGQVPASLQANLQRFADLGVEVRITELDIRIPLPADETRLAQQAADYRTVIGACLTVEGCTGVTLWGITDKYSWIPDVFPGQGSALVWDANYAPKPAYAAIASALGAGAVTEPTPVPTPTSEPTAEPTVAPTSTPSGPSCSVTYRANAWTTGFTTSVTVKNTSTTAVSGWSLSFTLPDGQHLTQGWSGRWSQAGQVVTVTNESWNGWLGAGQSVGIGFNGSHTGNTSAPTRFAASSVVCD